MKRNNILSLFVALTVTLVTNAQNVDFKAGNFKDKKDEFKAAVEHIKKGDEFYEQGTEAIFNTQQADVLFKKALHEYIPAQKFNPSNAELNYKIGVCYIYSTSKYKAPKYIKKAAELDAEVDNFLPYYRGFAHQLEGEFDDALKSYKTFEAEYKKADNFSKFVSQRKKECAIAKDRVSKPERVWVDNVKAVNSSDDDINPSISTDGEQMIFTSNRKNSKSPDEIGEYDMDIYATEYVDGFWKKPEPMKGAINTIEDDYSSNLSADGTKMLMYKDVGGQFDIFETFLKGSDWSAPVSFASSVNTKDNQTHASYYFDRIKVYYIANKSTGALAAKGNDVYLTGVIDRKTRKYGSGTPVSEVSSKFHEGSIFMHPDGETMYLCSEGHGSMGGMDIFVSVKKQGIWTTPVNLGYPINTPYDDYIFAATGSGKYAYISSNRPGGMGGMDIYKVTFWGPDKPLQVDTEDFLLASIVSPIQDNEIKSAKTVDRKSLTVFKGKTIDALTKKPVEADIEIIDNSNGRRIDQVTTNSATGKFLVSLLAGKNYGIAVKADGYLFHSENFDIAKGSAYNMVNKIIELKNIKIGSKIALRNIFFETAKATLKSESNNELDRLVKLMKDVPGLKVEISGHTDNTGSAKLNDKLSQDRAQSVVDYLVGKGISKSRMTAKGYGSTIAVASNNSAEGRQQNRRVEFEITGN